MPNYSIQPGDIATLSEFLAWDTVVMVSVALTIQSASSMKRWEPAVRSSMAMSIAAMVPGLPLLFEQLWLLEREGPFNPKTVALGLLWIGIGPLLFLRSFKRVPLGRSPGMFQVVRLSHVVAWAASSWWSGYLGMLA